MELDEFEYGAGESAVSLSANVVVHTCNDCDFEFTGPSAEAARHQAVCRHLGIMTPGEISGTAPMKHMRQEYDFSKGKRGPILRSKGKTRVKMYLDNEVIEAFRAKSDEVAARLPDVDQRYPEKNA